MPVKSPMRKMAVWPKSWKCFNLRRTTVWPRWMSGAVGSTPSLTRSGRPAFCASARRARSSGSLIISAQPLRREASCRSRSRWRGALTRFSASFGANYPAALDAELAAEHQIDGFGIDAVFFAQDAGRQSLFRVVIVDGDDRLRHDGPGLQVLVPLMPRAARK